MVAFAIPKPSAAPVCTASLGFFVPFFLFVFFGLRLPLPFPLPLPLPFFFLPAPFSPFGELETELVVPGQHLQESEKCKNLTLHYTYQETCMYLKPSALSSGERGSKIGCLGEAGLVPMQGGSALAVSMLQPGSLLGKALQAADGEDWQGSVSLMSSNAFCRSSCGGLDCSPSTPEPCSKCETTTCVSKQYSWVSASSGLAAEAFGIGDSSSESAMWPPRIRKTGTWKLNYLGPVCNQGQVGNCWLHLLYLP